MESNPIAEHIFGRIAIQRISLTTLSELSGISYSTFMRHMDRPEKITIGELGQLNKWIHIDPVLILKAVGFTGTEIYRAVTGVEDYKKEV